MEHLIYEALVSATVVYDKVSDLYQKYAWPLIGRGEAVKSPLAKVPAHVLLIIDNLPSAQELVGIVLQMQEMHTSRISILLPTDSQITEYVEELCPHALVYVDHTLQHFRSPGRPLFVNLLTIDSRVHVMQRLARLQAKGETNITLPRLESELSSLPAVDLIISLQKRLSLARVPSWQIGFAEIYHAVNESRVTRHVLLQAYASFAGCRQNFGH